MQHAFPRQFNAQFKRAAHGFDKTAQCREIQVGLLFDLMDRWLFDTQRFCNMLLASAQRSQSLDLGDQLLGAGFDLAAACFG